MWLDSYRQAKDLLLLALELTDNTLVARNSRRTRTLLVLARFTCFTGTKVQILMLTQPAAHVHAPRACRVYADVC